MSSSSLSKSDLLRLARAGATARIAELRQEIESIYRAFPGIRKSGGPAAAAAAPSKRKPGLRGWTPAQRKAAAERMKKYWAARKGGKK